MVLLLTGYTLEMSLPSLISQKSKLQTLLAKFSILANLAHTENRLFFSSAMVMTSLLRHTWVVVTYFGMYGKRRPIAILWYKLHVSGGFHFQDYRWW